MLRLVTGLKQDVIPLQKSMIKLLSLADLISIVNAVFGFLAVLFLFSDAVIPLKDTRIHVSFSFILLALLADGLDGIVARWRGSSRLGEYLESMADMSSLCIAPAVFIYFVYSPTMGCCLYRYVYLLIALILFLFFGVVRLASFHIMKQEKFFIGLPASASAIMLLVMSYFMVEFIYILPAVVIIGAVMISDIRFPKPSVRMNIVAALLIFLAILIGKNFYGFAPGLLFIMVLLYAVFGPFYAKLFSEKLNKNISK